MNDLADPAALERRRLAAMLAGDLPALQDLLGEDLLYVHSSGLRDSRDSYLGHLREGRLRYLRLAFTQLEARPFAGGALVMGRMQGAILLMGKEEAIHTMFLTAWSPGADGRWRLRAHQGTPVAG